MTNEQLGTGGVLTIRMWAHNPFDAARGGKMVTLARIRCDRSKAKAIYMDWRRVQPEGLQVEPTWQSVQEWVD